MQTNLQLVTETIKAMKKRHNHDQKPFGNYVGPPLNHFKKKIITEFNPGFPSPGEYKNGEGIWVKSRGDILSQLSSQARYDDKSD